MTTTVLHDTNHVRMIEAQHRDELKLFYRGVMERTAAVEPADVLAAHLCVDADVLHEVVDRVLDQRPWSVTGSTYPQPPSKWMRRKDPECVHCPWDVLQSIFEARPLAAPFGGVPAPWRRESSDGRVVVLWSWSLLQRPVLAVDIDTHSGFDAGSIARRVQRLSDALGAQPLFGQLSPGGAWFYWRLSMPLELEEQRRLLRRRLDVRQLGDAGIEVPEVPRMPLGGVLLNELLGPLYPHLLHPRIRATFRKGAEIEFVEEVTRVRCESYNCESSGLEHLPFRFGGFLDFQWAVAAPTVEIDNSELGMLRYDEPPDPGTLDLRSRRQPRDAGGGGPARSWRIPAKWEDGIVASGQTNAATRDLSRACKNAFPSAANTWIADEILRFLESRPQGLIHSNHSPDEVRQMVLQWLKSWKPPPTGRPSRASPIECRVAPEDVAPLAHIALSAVAQLVLSAMIRFAKAWGEPTDDGWDFTLGHRQLQCALGRGRRSSTTVKKAITELQRIESATGPLLEVVRPGRRGANTHWRLRLPLTSGGELRAMGEIDLGGEEGDDPLRSIHELGYKAP